jgi:hypothetical protein
LLSVVPLLIDDPELPREARDLLIASSYAGRLPSACVARRKVAEILASRYALTDDELDALLDLHCCQG